MTRKSRRRLGRLRQLPSADVIGRPDERRRRHRNLNWTRILSPRVSGAVTGIRIRLPAAIYFRFKDFFFLKHFVYIPYTYTYDIVLSYMCNISSISFLYLLLKCLRNTNEIFMNSCIQKRTKYNPTFVIVSLDDLSAWIIKLFCECNK